MREADGALISHLDDLQARLSRVAALSAPVDVAFASARPSPARALKSRAAHSPRPTPVPHSPPASPALEGRAAYYQTRDIVPRRAKARHQLGGSETARGPPSPFATRHETTRDFRDSALFHHRANAPPSPRASSSPIRPSPASNEPPPSEREGLERGQRERENVLRKTYDASFYVAELDATRAKLLDAESRFSAARRDAEVLAERLRLAGEAEAACAARVVAIVEEAERVAREATRGTARRSEIIMSETERKRGAREKKEKRKGDDAFASRAAAARVAAAEARGEAARLVSALGADPELADGLVRKLGEVSRLVADLAAAAEE